MVAGSLCGEQARLGSEYPHLKCTGFAKPTFSRPMPAELAGRLKRCSAVVAALAVTTMAPEPSTSAAHHPPISRLSAALWTGLRLVHVVHHA